LLIVKLPDADPSEFAQVPPAASQVLFPIFPENVNPVGTPPRPHGVFGDGFAAFQEKDVTAAVVDDPGVCTSVPET
jgi:hypothetical protein